MPALTSEIWLAAWFSAAATILSVLVAHWLRGRVNLITFSPNSTYFKLEPPENSSDAIHIRSGQIMVQNLGRQAARDVQITSVPGLPPAGYVLIPSIVHTTRSGANNEWIVEIPFIAPKELITLQVLNGPIIDSVRSSGGVARAVPVTHQRLFPRWAQFIFSALMLFGVASFFFLIASIIL